MSATIKPVFSIGFIIWLKEGQMPPGNIFFWIKCHPNLSNVFWDYHKKVFTLHDPTNNIFVIPPNSKVDTYSMLRVCEKAITFNSLIGIESVYWKITLRAVNLIVHANNRVLR